MGWVVAGVFIASTIYPRGVSGHVCLFRRRSGRGRLATMALNLKGSGERGPHPPGPYALSPKPVEIALTNSISTIGQPAQGLLIGISDAATCPSIAHKAVESSRNLGER